MTPDVFGYPTLCRKGYAAEFATVIHVVAATTQFRAEAKALRSRSGCQHVAAPTGMNAFAERRQGLASRVPTQSNGERRCGIAIGHNP